jgi:16S rRNA (uracil1498-N3)-methyltransferase
VSPALRRSAAHVFVDSLSAPVLDDADHHHLGRVLRLRPGEPVSASDGRGGWRSCSYTGSPVLDPTDAIEVLPPPAPAITIGFALPKGDRPEWIVQKLTEIGVDRIVVLDTGRAVVRWVDDRASHHVAKLHRVAREAAMQSRRVRLPAITGPVEPTTLCGALVALAEPDGEQLTLTTPTVLIGPEGGWTLEELAPFEHRCQLGPTILRVETAALVAAARLVALRDH